MPVITGICTKWLKNSQQNSCSPTPGPQLYLGLTPPKGWGEIKESKKLLQTERRNYQQQSQEVKQQPKELNHKN